MPESKLDRFLFYRNLFQSFEGLKNSKNNKKTTYLWRKEEGNEYM